ncbi:MAG: hypothetical protein PHO03_03140 [Candidatus Omnitrophica bacterium]|nr:hypothetical protein [Candidatus Omnitrophota bacterium]
MPDWLISPPVVFIIILAVILLLNRLVSKLAFRVKKPAAGSAEPYACGECDYNNMAQPDYSQFFPYAFFFTLAHVATLIITTVPAADRGILVMAGLYILGAVTSLIILLKK